MTQTKDQTTTETEKDYSKPHAFEMEVGRITRVCKCGQPEVTAIHAITTITLSDNSPELKAFEADVANRSNVPYTKHTNICLQKADDDMPLFVLKPTDASAIECIEYWYMLGISKGVSRAKLDDALELRNAFKAWQTAHPNRVHNPD